MVKSGTTGNISYQYIYTSQTDYNSVKSEYFTAMAALVDGYTEGNRIFTLPPNTSIDYYKYVIFRYIKGTTIGDTYSDKSIVIHYGTFVNFDDVNKVISFNMSNVLFGFTPIGKICGTSTAVANNCSTLGTSDNNYSNTVQTGNLNYNDSTTLKFTKTIYAVKYNTVAPPVLQSVILPYVQDRIWPAFFGSPYSIFPTATVPNGFCRDLYGNTSAKIFRSYRFWIRGTITNTTFPADNFRIESALDYNGCETSLQSPFGIRTWTVVYEIQNGEVITKNCGNIIA
jgi:hypothetical protein